MTGLLAIVFLASIVGIIKPYAGNLNRKHFAGIAAAAFVAMIFISPESALTTKPSGVAVADVSEKASQSIAEPSEQLQPKSRWSYDESKDEMRDTVTRFASITSDNEVDLDFPYVVQSGQITIRRRAQDGLNVMFSVGKGQILCHSFSRSNISIKFDNGPIRQFDCTGSSDGSSETAFFTNEGAVLSGLKKAKRTVVEVEFFQKGRQQFIFETAGLEWK